MIATPTQTSAEQLSTDLVTYQVIDAVAHVRLNRPDKLNALTLPLLAQMTAMADRVRADRQIRAVVVSGEGDAFCAGLDFADVLRAPAQVFPALLPRVWRRDAPNAFQSPGWAWRTVPVPVIAAIHGHCLGGGVQLALGADYRFTTADARWSVLEAKWGLIPDMSGIAALTQLVGIDVAKRLTMTGEIISGEQAVSYGLASQVAADPVAAATELANQIATRSPDSVAATKRLFERSWPGSARATLVRERLTQVLLLTQENTKQARRAALSPGASPRYRPRGWWW